MLDKINGFKMHGFFALMILLGVMKIFTDIPEFESITILGITEGTTLLSSGILGMFGRDALKKLEA